MSISFNTRERWSCSSSISCSSLPFWPSGYLKIIAFASCTRREERWCTVSADIAGWTGNLLLGKLETRAQMAKYRNWRKCANWEVNRLVKGAAARRTLICLQVSCGKLPCHPINVAVMFSGGHLESVDSCRVIILWGVRPELFEMIDTGKESAVTRGTQGIRKFK